MWIIFKSLLNMLQYCFCFKFWFFGHEACGIMAPRPRIEPTAPAWEGEVFFFFFFLFLAKIQDERICFFFFFSVFTSNFLFILFYFFFICSEFCHTLKWNSHGFTCVPHLDPPSHLPLHPIPLGLPSAPGPSACLMHPTWAGDLFHPR